MSTYTGLSAKMRSALRQAGEAIKVCEAGESLDKATLETLYDAFKTAAAQCPSKSVDGAPVLDEALFGLIVTDVLAIPPSHHLSSQKHPYPIAFAMSLND